MIGKRLLDRLLLDRTLGYALAMRCWQALSGPITIALVIGSLSEADTGVFYGLVAVVGIQAFFELGLLNVLIGHAGHAYAKLELDKNRPLDEGPSAGRMRELIVASGGWFALMAAGYCLVGSWIGWQSFTNSGSPVPLWLGPLMVTVPLAALVVYLSPRLAILEGSGQRESIYRFRVLQMVSGSLAVWTMLALGWQLWAIPVATGIQAGWSLYIIYIRYHDFFKTFQKAEADPTFSWRHDVLPAQWRAAACGAAYHLATQLFVVILLNAGRSVEAGQLGMTLSITGAIQMLALAWVQTKFPIVSQQLGSGHPREAARLWQRTTLVSACMLVAGFIALAVLLSGLPALRELLNERGFKDRDLAARFIAPQWCLIYAIGCLGNHLIAAQGFYVLACKSKPLVVATVSGWLTVALAVWVAGLWMGSEGIILAFSWTTLLVALPLHAWAYHRFRREFDESASAQASS